MSKVRKFGVDISEHNGVINFAELKNHVDFVIIRVGFGAMKLGNNSGVDKYFERNVNECIKHGIPFGFYHASYAWSVDRAKLEAQHMYEMISKYKPEYPIYWDFEGFSVDYAQNIQNTKITKKLASDMARAYFGYLENKGYFVGNYANPNFMKNYFDEQVNTKYSLWLAHWVDEKNKYTNAPLWQYGSKGKVSGINGNVDVNICYYDFPSVIKNNGLNGFTKPKPQPTETKEQKALKEIKGIIKKYGV